ncbi:MAG TPA: RNA pseudouridine synthase [Verrucomicrobiae bacterium]|nr:RNA pseudouridine synthase [Verrucomicrobiae bacterium]
MKTDSIELPTGEKIPILYEDRSVLAIDKPRGWMLVPASWQKTNRNLQMALTSSIAARDFWARSRNLKFLRFVHRLDADTTGILLFAKSLGAVNTFGDLFESRKMEKTYLAVAHGAPKEAQWTCRLKIGPDLDERGKMRVDPHQGKEAETVFRVIQTVGGASLIEARPYTGRTHQIRVHLAAAGHAIVGDEMYGSTTRKELGLRAIVLAYSDPFSRRPVQIRAPIEEFCRRYGFQSPKMDPIKPDNILPHRPD